MFNCGKLTEFPETFQQAFQLSPLVNSDLSGKQIHFYPMNFQEFSIFLFKLSIIDVKSKLNSHFSSLYSHVRGPFFERLFLEYNVKDLYNAELEENSNEQITVTLLMEFWSEYNFLYPTCQLRDIQREKSHFASGTNGICYRITSFNPIKNSFLANFPQQLVFKSIRRFKEIFFGKYSLSYVINLNELKYCLFFKLHQCPSIHLLNCLVVNREIKDVSIACGYLSEAAEFDNLLIFVMKYKIFGNYQILLSELFSIAKAIHFIHQQKLIHYDIKCENILVFESSKKQERIQLKLTDFGSARTRCSYEPDKSEIIERTKQNIVEVYPDFIEGDSFFDKIIERNDWIGFAHIIKIIVDNIKIPTSDLTLFANLIRILTGHGYWKQEDIFETIRKCFEEDVSICQIEEPFTMQLRV